MKVALAGHVNRSGGERRAAEQEAASAEKGQGKALGTERR